MKILVMAAACNPYLGSESHFGWSAVQCLARSHDVWVLTSERSRAHFEKARAAGLVPSNLTIIHVGRSNPWHPNRLRARLQGWREYLQFSKDILPVAQAYHERVGFDLAHHITYATWRVASPLPKLGIPFVFGPVGGNEQFPFPFFPVLSGTARAFELLRIASNATARYSPAVRRCIRDAAHVFVANSETERLIRRIRNGPDGVSQLSPAFYTPEKISLFSQGTQGKKLDGPLRFFAGGNLEGRKGVGLALKALARVKARGVKFRYLIGGGGPERQSLERLSSQLGLQNEVLFGEPLSGEAYVKELGSSHAFLLPSFRESAGLTMMEAMLAGCVPIVADCGGPADIVSEESGFKVPVTTPDQMIEGLAQIIERIHADRQLLGEKGRAASARIASHFSDNKYLNEINTRYQCIVGSASGSRGITKK